VAYIDPRSSPDADRGSPGRGPESTGELRLGMYVRWPSGRKAPAQRTVIPRSAVQTVGDRRLCTCPPAETEAQFVERPVRLGAACGET